MIEGKLATAPCMYLNCYSLCFHASIELDLAFEPQLLTAHAQYKAEFKTDLRELVGEGL